MLFRSKTHHHAVDFNIFEGLRVKGLTQTTLSGGRVVFDEGKVHSKPGSGRYIARENYGFSYERVIPKEEMRKIRETPVDRSGKGPSSPATMSDKLKQLQTELEISQDIIKQLKQQLEHAQKQSPSSTTSNSKNVWDTKTGELTSVEDVLTQYIPDKEREEVRRILFGVKSHTIEIPEAAKAIAKKLDFEIAGYKIPEIGRAHV